MTVRLVLIQMDLMVLVDMEPTELIIVGPEDLGMEVVMVI